MYTHTRGCVKGMRTFSYMPFICVLRHFRVYREGRPKIKIAKKYAKIWWSQKKDVILHRGFVRALGRVDLLVSSPWRVLFEF